MSTHERPFKEIEEIAHSGSRSRIFRVPGRSDVVIREMPRNYGVSNSDWEAYREFQARPLSAAEKLSPHVRMQRILEDLDEYVPVPDYHLVEYEVENVEGGKGSGKQEVRKAVGAMIENIEGVSLSDLEIDPENASVLDGFVGNFISYLRERWDDNEEFPAEFALESFMYGHRVDRKGNRKGDNTFFYVDIDPDYTHGEIALAGTIIPFFQALGDMIRTYRRSDMKQVDFPHIRSAINEVVRMSEESLRPKAPPGDYSNRALEMMQEAASRLLRMIEL